ncbi:CinA family nicotinamide mononucleotide deamidase-related protein [Streptobacillus canis]|uniref:CinA family nicotinamide mononucleotide deamidase-related protein n=1 Tax=Streptobacillus canis TaxID=2678686 RepID=UPI0012E18204|nr:CinA family nicotinamide mononucleotide deamidase-related protein [Streptobacillus canis]
MNVGLISVGTEIIIGDILNTNVHYLSQELAKFGINVYLHTSVGDNVGRLTKVIDDNFKMVDTLILTGGLGPTDDDITKEVAAKYLDIELKLSKKEWERIREYGEKYSPTSEATKNNIKQAMLPVNSIILPNIVGTAPGAIMEREGKRIIILPGPPGEMKSMYQNALKPYLKQYSDKKIISKYIRIYGIGESALEDRLDDLMKAQDEVTIALYAKSGEVLIRVTTSTKSMNEIDEIIEKIKEKCGEYIYLIGDEDISESQSELPNVVSDKLKKYKSLEIFETGTFGLLTQTLTKTKNVSKILKQSKIILNPKETVEELLENMKEEVNIVVKSDADIHDNKLTDDVRGIIGIKIKGKTQISNFHFKGVKDRVIIRVVSEVLDKLNKNLKRDIYSKFPNLKD